VVDGRLRAVRETDRGEAVYELETPVVLSVAQRLTDAAEPAGDARIEVLTAADLVDEVLPDDKRFGQTGSPTRVLAVRDVTPERARELFEDPARAVRRARELLGERQAAESTWEKPERLGEHPGRSYDCWSVVEL